MSGRDPREGRGAVRVIEGEPPDTRDGRNVAPDFGALTGEAATIAATRPEAAWPIAKRAHESEASSTSYYELPALKEPVWKAWIPVYFFTGGVAGATATLGAAAQILGRGDRSLRPLVRAARVVALGTLGVSAVCLIADLGKPSRFLNMLRVFRPTSPMNVGTWMLSASGATTAASVLLPLLGARGARAGDVAGVAAGALGVPLAGYTAVLVANTAVPVWSEGSRALPALFYASAAASGAAALELVPGVASGRRRRVLAAFGAMGKAAELVTGFFYQREVERTSARVGEPLRAGASGKLWTASKLLTGASLVLGVLAKRRRTQVAAAAAGLAGALTLRFAVMQAGKASARDPHATFDLQRARARGPTANAT